MASLLDTLLKFGAISTSYFDLGVDAGREGSRVELDLAALMLKTQ